MPERRKKISYQEFLQREYGSVRAPLAPEMDFYETIRAGNIRKLRTLLNEPFHAKKGLGVLSTDTLRNLKYHLTVTTALVARFCISGGLSQAEAYSLSDYYIRLVDEASSPDEITDIHNEMCLHYARQMQNLRRSTITSKAVRTAIDYIYEHLHTRITLEQLSSLTNLSAPYLSRLFKKETGSAVSDYILSKKLETAKSMLASSSYSIAEISASLAFPSQSYFTNVLKKDCGMTPKEYRNKNRNSDYYLQRTLMG
ncbi:MAG: AraC family transcriptional regulator [Clostridiales bacterium]|nr:AraC family transcriptional regulator [Clostridiales bacterium]